ncbi:ATP-binding cassette domain-containing protein [Butyrivibrio sp. JL13D10]|uniref:ATP-binding cassette domain-containing protein n=1 Tax=Butyrivibrio sp. JL13D10 TaxID=3236815 RepID=UPI0038B437C0
MEDLLVMRNITKCFPGSKALDNVSFSVKAGEIHALVGENGAGKSTLMNILSGNIPFGQYEGELLLDGKRCQFKSPKDSEAIGIVIVHQELSLVQSMSIADNLFLGNEKGSRFVLDRKKTLEEAKKVLSLVNLTENPATTVERINAGEQQLVEIAKALSKNSRILILDEPTSSLGEEHSAALLKLMKELKAKGHSMIIISHKLNEIFDVADRITILRDGKTIETLENDRNTIDKDRIIHGMIGRDLDVLYPEKKSTIKNEVALKVEHYNIESVRRKGALSLEDISFHINKGEVVGLYGLLASGRSKLAKSLFGRSNKFNAYGTVEIDGKKVDLHTPKEAIMAGIAYVADDRIQNGLSLDRSIRENTTLAGIHKLTNYGFLDKKEERNVAEDSMVRFHTKARSIEQTVKELSGGNQQKVLLSEWLYTDPKVLILDEPTRGIDVGARYEIYCIINDFVAEGGAVLLISSELPEIMGLSDRIYVLSEGRITGEVDTANTTPEEIMSLIVGEGQKE